MSASRQTISNLAELDRWTASVIADGRLTAACRLVAISLRLHANLRTGQLNPSMDRLGRCTSQRTRSCQRHIADLKAAGYIAVSASNGRTSNAYALTLPATLTDQSPSTGVNPDPRLTSTLTSQHRQPGPTCRPNILRNILEHWGKEGEVLVDQIGVSDFQKYFGAGKAKLVREPVFQIIVRYKPIVPILQRKFAAEFDSTFGKNGWEVVASPSLC